ncbi:MAG: hypothetical protein Tsb0021_13160 [Chlamydiales bacterium]
MKKWFWLSGALIIFTAFIIFRSLFVTDQRDVREYQELANSTDQSLDKSEIKSQHRTYVKKDFFLKDQQKNLQQTITADESDVMIVKGHHGIEIVEQMTNISCLLQVKLFEEPYPWQSLRCIQCKNGCFNYRHQVFTGTQALLSEYQLPGHKLAIEEHFSPYLTGNAQEIYFNLGKHSELHAYGVNLEQLSNHFLFPSQKDSQSHHLPFSLKCDEMHYFKKNESIFGKNVVLTLKQKFKILADRAEINIKENQARFYCENDKSYATLEGDLSVHENTINFTSQAQEFKFYVHENAYCLEAKGSVKLLAKEGWIAKSDKALLKFSTPQMTAGTLTLSSEVPFTLCSIESERGDVVEGAKIRYDTAKQVVQIANGKGKTSLSYQKSGNVFFSAEKISWNRATGILVMRGNVKLDNPEMGSIYSDQAHLHYDVTNNIAKKIDMQGNIKMYNQAFDYGGFISSLDQMVIADKLTYLPEDGNLILKAIGNGRVLFYDKSNEMQISAPMVSVTNGKTVKGSGDVRFTFADNELEQLKTTFPNQF